MINHARTLLLNPKQSQNPGPDFVGEEFVPSDYTYIEIPRRLNRVRDILFGGNADRAMKNYRLREVMALLHSSELAEYVTDLDPRITYLPQRSDIFDSVFGATVVSQHSVATSYATIEGTEPKTTGGRLFEQWTITVDSLATSVDVRRHTPPASEYSVAITSPLTDPISLPGSSLSVRIVGPIAGHVYNVTSLKRPEHNLAHVIERLRTGIGAASEAELFYKTSEPYKTFKNLWFKNPHLPYKAGGLLLAFIYRLEDFRNAT